MVATQSSTLPLLMRARTIIRRSVGVPLRSCDPVSSLTHLAAAAVFAILSVPLIRPGRGDARRVISLAVFAFSCVLLLSLSGVYPLLSPETAARGVLMRLDHAAVFVLIAGSFTPVHVIPLRERWQRYLLACLWSAALAGLALKMVYFNAVPSWLGLLMGRARIHDGLGGGFSGAAGAGRHFVPLGVHSRYCLQGPRWRRCSRRFPGVCHVTPPFRTGSRPLPSAPWQVRPRT
jgi:hypothetical protein